MSKVTVLLDDPVSQILHDRLSPLDEYGWPGHPEGVALQGQRPDLLQVAQLGRDLVDAVVLQVQDGQFLQ